MIFRFRDELREGNDVETSLVETMTHAGHSVIVSGTTVAIGLLAMVLLPVAVAPVDGYRRNADSRRLGRLRR
jgi:RND superfamily putative drug exporter